MNSSRYGCGIIYRWNGVSYIVIYRGEIIQYVRYVYSTNRAIKIDVKISFLKVTNFSRLNSLVTVSIS